MLGTKSLVEACHRLFATYPLAVKSANRNGTIQTMVLLLRDGDDVNYFMLSHDRRDGRPPYSLRPWRATEAVDIRPSDSTALPDVVLNALIHGVPIPRHGSLFGWVYRKSITVIIPVYTTYTPANPYPSLTAMGRYEEAPWFGMLRRSTRYLEFGRIHTPTWMLCTLRSSPSENAAAFA